MSDKKQTTIVIHDKNQRIRNQVAFIKSKYQGWKVPTISSTIRELINEKYNQLKNEKI